MAAFSYEALDNQGKSQRGVLEADTARGARSALRARGLVPLSVMPLGASRSYSPANSNSAPGPSLWQRRAFRASELAVWTRQLAGLVGAGLSLERALSSLSEEAETIAQRNVVAVLRAEVNSGSSFATALAQHPAEFSAIYVAVIEAGEHSGSLALVLERLADELEEQQNLASKLLGAALYPGIVSAVAIAIVMFLLAYVVPQVAQVFVGSKKSLPLITTIMLGISSAVRSYGWVVLLIGALSITGLRLAWRQAAFQKRWDAAWLRLPVLGRLSQGYNAARFASTLALLCAAGVPILKAIQSAGETLSNRAMADDALETLTLVREGAPLAHALSHSRRFPLRLSMFARIGEQTGRLPEMLDRAALQLRTEVQRRAINLATILEPLLIVAMGVIVMLIVLAVLMPIIQLNQLVK